MSTAVILRTRDHPFNVASANGLSVDQYGIQCVWIMRQRVIKCVCASQWQRLEERAVGEM